MKKETRNKTLEEVINFWESEDCKDMVELYENSNNVYEALDKCEHFEMIYIALAICLVESGGYALFMLPECDYDEMMTIERIKSLDSVEKVASFLNLKFLDDEDKAKSLLNILVYIIQEERR